jgi:hypothetical protein
MKSIIEINLNLSLVDNKVKAAGILKIKRVKNLIQ